MSGIPVSAGVTVGPAMVLDESPVLARLDRVVDDGPHEPETELARLLRARDNAFAQLLEMRERVAEAIGGDETGIFDAHLLMVRDDTFLAEVAKRLQASLCSAEEALRGTLRQFSDLFSSFDTEAFRERVADLHDVWSRVGANLAETDGREQPEQPTEPFVLVARQLLPSDLATLDLKLVRGLATEKGGPASHVAVLSHALGVPYIIGVEGVHQKVRTGDLLALDGGEGAVHLHPGEDTIRRLQASEEEWCRSREEIHALDPLPAVTTCGQRIKLRANICFVQDADFAQTCGADGVGLFRTEFIFMGLDSFPTQEEQFQEYRRVVEAMAPHRVVFRTMDIGGEKLLPYFPVPYEPNPHLGWRAIRLSLDHPDRLREQMQAVLRAAVHGPCGLMVPMLSAYEELLAARDNLDESKRLLREQGHPFEENLPFGVMVETPSAVLIADHLLEAADFLSVGTNDLTQFLMAADRDNARVNHLFTSVQPSLLRAIRDLLELGREVGKPVSICGEMAADPLCTVLLLGLGLTEFSMPAR